MTKKMSARLMALGVAVFMVASFAGTRAVQQTGAQIQIDQPPGRGLHLRWRP